MILEKLSESGRHHPRPQDFGSNFFPSSYVHLLIWIHISMFHGFQQTVQQIWDRKVSSDIWTRFLLPKSSWIRKSIRGSQNKQWHHLFSPDYMETLWSRHLDSVLNSLVRLSSFKIYNVIQNYHSFFRKWTNDKSLILMLVWCLDGFLLLKFGCWR